MFLVFFLAAKVTCPDSYRELRIEDQIGMCFSVQGNDYEHNHVLLYLASRTKTRLERQREKYIKTVQKYRNTFLIENIYEDVLLAIFLHSYDLQISNHYC